jgi:hypothetical protein
MSPQYLNTFFIAAKTESGYDKNTKGGIVRLFKEITETMLKL